MAANLTATTSSFVAEVLATAGRVEKEDIIAKIVKLSKHVDELKVEVHDTLQKNYAEFYPNLSMALELRARVEKTSDEMELVANRVEKEIKSQLNVSAAEFQDLSSQLNVANHTLAILDHLVKMNDLLQTVESSLSGKEYTTTTESVEAIETLLSQVQGDLPENAIKVLTAINNRCLIQKQKLVFDLSEMWSEDVRWTLPKDGADQKTPVKVELMVASGNKVKKRLRRAFEPMWKLGVLPNKLRVFGQRFLRHMVAAIVVGGKVAVKVNTSNDQKPSVVITVVKPGQDVSNVTLLSVLTSLTGVFTAISEHLLGLELPGCDSSGTVPLMRKLGEIISVDCLDLIIQNCLSKTIPSSARELDSYGDVIMQTETFRDTLVSLQFISVENTTLMDYVNNVNVLFASKQCQDALEMARSLLVSDIHNMVLIRHDTPLGQSNVKGFGRSGTKKSVKMNANEPLSCNTKLSANTFTLPTCNISVSTQKLVQLAYDVLCEATTGTESSANQIYTVRSMFELFCIVVPTFHKRELQNLPQVAALHHNNCMYLAHHLLTLGHQFQSQLPKPLTMASVTFVDLVPKLRRLGTECFMRCLQKQRDELIGCLKNARGFNGLSDNDTFDDAKRAINQLLHELQHLGRVWTVLPPSVYYMSMGTLLNSAVTDIMSYITTLEDISADDASLLHTLLTTMAKRASNCFQPPVGDPDGKPELFKHVAKWLKFKELMLVLNAGLHDIADRWADGKGPLAQEFTGAEVKQLVRALFQNTERRAAVLAKIR